MPRPYLPTYDPETYDPYGEQPPVGGRREYSGGSTQIIPTISQPGAPNIPYYGNQGGGTFNNPSATNPNPIPPTRNQFDFNSIWDQAQNAYGADAIAKYFNLARGNLNRSMGNAASFASRAAGAAGTNMVNPSSFIQSAISQAQGNFAPQFGQLAAGQAQAQQQGQAELTKMLYLINRAKQGDAEAAAQLKARYDEGAEMVRQFNANREDNSAGWWDYLTEGIGTAATAFAAFSDIRLKDNLKKVGETKSGLNLYTWEWKDSAKNLVGDSPTIGVIAQEVKNIIPEAVSVDKSGYLMVNYNLI